MDVVETYPGNTVYLPVFVPGGFLYLGDAHAAMGHGELSATGLEMPSESVVTVELIKHRKIPGPRIESPTEKNGLLSTVSSTAYPCPCSFSRKTKTTGSTAAMSYCC